MTAPTLRFPRLAEAREHLLPLAVGGVLFVLLFARPAVLLADDWWNDPEAGHGLLLAPVALWLAWRAGLAPRRTAAPVSGAILLAGAVLLRWLAGLAMELLTLRLSLVGALAGLVVFAWGWGQLRRWWLPTVLLALAIPLPDVIVGTLALPLQFVASKFGAALLASRSVPVRLDGNLISLPGHQLFVTEACSGLRSLTALVSLGVLAGGLWLRTAWGRLALVALTIPVAVFLNGIRVFLTGFLVFFVDPKLGEGFMHATEGWLIFVVAFAILGGLGWLIGRLEGRPRPAEAPRA